MDISAQKELLKKAWLEIRQLKLKLSALEDKTKEPIAIVGMGCRLPMQATIYDNSLWNFLLHQRNSISEVPASRWNIADYYHEDPTQPGCTYTQYGSFLESPYNFDAKFFGISPREAVCIDPQQRLALEVVWEALENAAIPPSQLKRSNTAIYFAQCADDYAQLVNKIESRHLLDNYSGVGTSRSMLAGRLAYFFDTRGAALQLDTSCSSSLVALHLAVQSLQAGESDAAIVGGVHLNLSPMSSILRSRTQALSKDGQCKAFSADANGFVQGEGVAVVVLKRLNQALAEKNRILAVIKGSAVNHDGASVGLTAPNEAAQVAVIEQALKNARVDPAEVSYIEAHGTGTKLGDPIEINALQSVYGNKVQKPIWIGSIKSNFGHLEAASGIVGVIKTILAMEHRKIPAHLHFQQPNPLINWEKIPFKVPTETIHWEADQKCMAGISSFGMSGTNAHVILEQSPHESVFKCETTEIKTEKSHLFTLSAKTPIALNALIKRYLEFFVSCEFRISDICYTANCGRDHFKYRIAVIVRDINELVAYLQQFLETQNNALEQSNNNLIENSLEKAARAYIQGEDVNWSEIYNGRNDVKVQLPTYAFEHRTLCKDSVKLSAVTNLA